MKQQDPKHPQKFDQAFRQSSDFLMVEELYGNDPLVTAAKKSYEAGQRSFDREFFETSTWLDFPMVEALHDLACHPISSRSLFEQLLEVSHTEASDWVDEIGDGSVEFFAAGFLQACCSFFHDVIEPDTEESESQAVVVH